MTNAKGEKIIESAPFTEAELSTINPFDPMFDKTWESGKEFGRLEEKLRIIKLISENPTITVDQLIKLI